MRVRGEHVGFVICYRLHVHVHVRSTSSVFTVKQEMTLNRHDKSGTVNNKASSPCF